MIRRLAGYDLTRSRLRPYGGVSAVGELELEEKYEFRFTNTLTNTTITVPNKRLKNDFNLLYARLNIGFSYPFLKKLKLQVEGSYDVPIDDKTLFDALWQVKGAVLYRF